MKNGGLVYSTNKELDLNKSEKGDYYKHTEFVISVCFEKKGRKGKGVTIIRDFQGSQMELSILAKNIKTCLGIGGSVKNNEILLQGRIQEKIIEILNKEGYKTKKVGG
tara:strand:+ start:20728 stop:21051 length:324 start_codon:yes stop_codon:yes gene_type:complete